MAAVSVSTTSIVVVVGKPPVQLTAELKDASGVTLSGRAVAWQSSDERIASVSTTGLVTAVGEGPVTITAISEGRQGSLGLTAQYPYPNVAGTYTFGATFDGVSGAQGTGTVTLIQTSRTNPAVTGTANVRASVGGLTFNMIGVYDAIFTDDGSLTFYLGGPARADTHWFFSGKQSGTNIVGRHNLTGTDGFGSFGSFVLAR